MSPVVRIEDLPPEVPRRTAKMFYLIPYTSELTLVPSIVFRSGELFHGMYVVYWLILCFSILYRCIVFGGGPCTLLTTGEGRASKCVSFPVCGQRNFFHYRVYPFKTLVTVEVEWKGTFFVHGAMGAAKKVIC